MSSAAIMPEASRPAAGDAGRIARSALPDQLLPGDGADIERWLDEWRARATMQVRRRPLAGLARWRTDPDTGDIHHETGGFFRVEGLDISGPGAPIPQWQQPIINQPEVGILGIVAKEFDGVLWFLMQAKIEPGNRDGIQIAPTVQATRSNYTRVHGGKAVPYLSYFQDLPAHRVIADVRQSEQGSWFLQKRNRNVIIETSEPVETRDGYRWMTLRQIHALLGCEDLVNMDARTVLSCLPFAETGVDAVLPTPTDDFQGALVASLTPGGSYRSMSEVLSLITDMRTRTEIQAKPIPLRETQGWVRTDEKISHETGAFFDVIGVEVTAGTREVHRWEQPMLAPRGEGLVAFLSATIHGKLHVLVNMSVEPGYVDVIELAPTVQCTPETYDDLPATARPAFLDAVLEADPSHIRFETVLSEEGGRFYQARNRYMVMETADLTEPPGYQWMTLAQLCDLLRHSHYVNVQARSLVACLYSLAAGRPA